MVLETHFFYYNFFKTFGFSYYNWEFLSFKLDKNLRICNDLIVLILCEYWFKKFSMNGQNNINSSNILDSLIFQIYVCLP